MSKVPNMLDDQQHSGGPAFSAKDLKQNDIILDSDRPYPQQYRVVSNGKDEVQLERHERQLARKQKRVSHRVLDTAKFVHIGVMPGFFRGIFIDVIKF